ncbi:hypothetical protein LDK61_09695, partial [Melissococcus plutonius]|uniref:hypothetical protein n=1 Tax=Melissococcus plutonius TaxID=33970 RepID=UPI0021E53678
IISKAINNIYQKFVNSIGGIEMELTEVVQSKKEFEIYIKTRLVEALWQENSAMVVAITELIRLYEIKI